MKERKVNALHRMNFKKKGKKEKLLKNSTRNKEKKCKKNRILKITFLKKF